MDIITPDHQYSALPISAPAKARDSVVEVERQHRGGRRGRSERHGRRWDTTVLDVQHVAGRARAAAPQDAHGPAARARLLRHGRRGGGGDGGRGRRVAETALADAHRGRLTASLRPRAPAPPLLADITRVALPPRRAPTCARRAASYTTRQYNYPILEPCSFLLYDK
ncbi:unnamed protein product, partial [Brenthis ino]